MKSTILAAGAALMLAAAVPAFAADTIQTSPALAFADRAPSLDTGSAQYQRTDGTSIGAGSEQIVVPNASQSEPQSLNSAPSGFYTNR